MEFTLTVKDPTPEVMVLLAPLMGGVKSSAPIGLGKAPVEAPKSTKTAPKPDPVETGFEEGAVSLEMLQTALTEKVQAGKTKAAKALLSKWEVAGVSKLDPSQYGEFYEELKAIK